MSGLEDRMKAALLEREKKGSLRQLPPEMEGIDFSSNDYLGFAKDLRPSPPDKVVLSAGATGSRLISGNSPLAESLEAQLALFHQADAGLLFTSGYTANIGLLSSVPKRGDTILYDQLIHASLRDGIRLSNAQSYSFRHNDLDHLTTRLQQAKGEVFIVTESLFSMDGDEPPLKEIVSLSKSFGAAIVLDEAHSTGVYGTKGEGLAVELGLEKEIWARVHTFGKAIGSHGAVVIGSNDLRSFLINFARSFIYTTALPPAQLLQLKAAYTLLEEDLQRRKALFSQIQLFQSLLSKRVRSRLIPARGPVQSLLVGGNEATKTLARQLVQSGIKIKAILHPTVSEGKERIRIALHSFNTDHEIRKLVACLENYLPDDIPDMSVQSSSSPSLWHGTR